MNKILTISIAAYNAEKYIKKAIESCIISDKYINFIEVIIVNDGSNDMTLCIAQEYERKYPNIVRIINKENGGYGSTINNSIKMASGKYFKLLDADDWFDTNNLEYLMKILMTTEDDMILTDYLLYYGESKTSNHIKFMLAPNKCLKIENLDFRTNLLMHGICYKTEILKKNYIEISEHCFYTDMEYVISYLPYIKTVRYINKDIYIYKLDNAGQSVSVSGIKKHYQDSKKVLLKILNQDCSSKLQIYKYQEAQFAKKVIDNYMIGMPILKVREQMKEIDLYIKNKDFAVYRLMKNKSLFLMRISNYFSVYIEILYKSLRNLDDR